MGQKLKERETEKVKKGGAANEKEKPRDKGQPYSHDCAGLLKKNKATASVRQHRTCRSIQKTSGEGG